MVSTGYKYVIIPTRRSLAEAVQITICYALGDASSSYIIGSVSTNHLLTCSLASVPVWTTQGAQKHDLTGDDLIFGAITCVTGILGIGIGAALSKHFKKKSPRADPLICAAGMLSSSLCLYLAIVLARHSIAATYVFIALGETLLALNWAIIADILLYVIIPTRRSLAEAVQITICHVLGDASSSYIIGSISDAIQKTRPASSFWKFVSLEHAFLLCPFVAVVRGALFLWTANHLEEDRLKASQIYQ
ncbi:protein spinster homolog 3-like, partial [Rhincodon typus]|uniref:protein spinster homolog 3-like n=1 Tax=Rhincodon typus TaxID=259920 RepID=UPI00202EC64E